MLVLSLQMTLPVSAQETEAPSVNPFVLQEGNKFGAASVADFQKMLPRTSDKVIEDVTIVRRPGAGVRVFRLYAAVPQHYHSGSDAYLYILSGRARFRVGGRDVEAKAGDLLFWAAGIMHGNPEILEGPVDVLVFDSPGRDPSDTFWASPGDAPGFLKD